VIALAVIILAAVILFACFRADGTTRLANVLHWVFSGVAVLLLLCGVLAIWGSTQPFVFVFLGIPALLAWLVGRACHYVLGGDASALWERALIAHAHRSPEFRNFGIGAVLLVVASVAWSIVDAAVP
jgi:hypothetical protein